MISMTTQSPGAGGCVGGWQPLGWTLPSLSVPVPSLPRPSPPRADRGNRQRSLDHFGTYVIFWPASAASAITPVIGLTKTATPSTNWVLVAVPSFAMTADALAPKLN